MGHHHPGLVVLSILIAVLASYTALDLANSVPTTRGRARGVWLAAGSLAMGFGIWSMHFTGMLAFRLPAQPIAYDVFHLIASVVVAVAASAVALYVITQPERKLTLAWAGLAMAAAIAGMHYTGMAGLHTSANVEWSWPLVVASIAIAIGASFVALMLALRVRSASGRRALLLKLGGSTVMGFAIAGMHYTAMHAATFVPHAFPAPLSENYLIATNGLGIALVGSTIIILAIAIGGSIIAREMNRRAALTNQLRASEEYFRAMIEHASDLIAVADANGMFTFVSSSFERTLGHAPEALYGTNIFALVHPEDFESAEQAFREITTGPAGFVRKFELRLAHINGGWRDVSGFGQNLLQNPAVRGLVFAAQDATDRRRLELQFQQSQKMEAVGNLAGGVAHDFNNLLTVILGNAQILISDNASNVELLEIREAAERAATLTRQLLAFSRRQVLQPRVVNLNDVVSGIEQMLTRLLGEHIRIESHLAQDIWRVSADSGQIEQTLMNLAVNARDAMPSGGVLSFSTRNCQAEETLDISHDVIPSAEYVCVAVRDTGTGIDSHTMTRMFEPFFTTKEIGKGTGIGLATVYGIMRQSGGYISVQTEVGGGSTFNLYFPRAPEPITAGSETEVSVSVARGQETILVVEDEDAVRSLVRRLLEKGGYRVLDSPNASHAFQLAHDHDGPIHLLLTDVVLQNLNGREVADHIIMIRPGIRVVFMSGYTEDEVLHRGVFSDSINFLQKPFEPATLLNTVRAALA